MGSGFYELRANNPQGVPVEMSVYEGKVVLVVNTATQCGLTPQFLGFPCNQFGAQEPLSNESMEETCKINHGVTFPLFEKIEVNGPHTHPLFRWLKSKLGGWFGSRIKWNFTKFLLDRNGRPVKRFAPVTRPADIEPHIRALLP
jgi:glutathione peroxidase